MMASEFKIGSVSMLRYFLSIIDPQAHLFSVVISLLDVGKQRYLTLDLPSWLPGSYVIRDFSRNLIDLKAYADDCEIKLDRVDKQTWRLPVGRSKVEIRYRVYAMDDSVRAAYLDQYRAFFNGSSLFLRVREFSEFSHRLSIDLPEDAPFSDWRIATSMARDADGEGYVSSNYDELIDHPFEIGRVRSLPFEVAGIPHELVLSGRYWLDEGRVLADLRRICSEHVALFDGELPLARYLFLAHVANGGYGGLEHRASSSLLVDRKDLAESLAREPGDGYRRFLGLCSHEYFHLWNVKRMVPVELQGVDCTQEVYTELLWVSEGITSYYDDLALVRARVVSVPQYLKGLAEVITRVHRGRGRQYQTLAESSFYAWTKFYKQDAGSPDSIVSYYAKGSLIALLMDDALRLGSNEKHSLDDFMRALWRRSGQRGVGFSEEDVREVLISLGMARVDDFFRSYIHGKEEMPLADVLLRYGVRLRWRVQQGSQDWGEIREGDENTTGADSPAWVGGILKETPAGLEVVHAYQGGMLQRAGLAPGDVIIALDGLKATEITLKECLRAYAPEHAFSAHYFRSDELHDTELVVRAGELDTCELTWIDEADLAVAQRRRRADWLRGAC